MIRIRHYTIQSTAPEPALETAKALFSVEHYRFHANEFTVCDALGAVVLNVKP